MKPKGSGELIAYLPDNNRTPIKLYVSPLLVSSVYGNIEEISIDSWGRWIILINADNGKTTNPPVCIYADKIARRVC